MPSNSPAPFLIALSMVSLGIFADLASDIACLSLGFESGSLPPSRDTIVSSFIILVKTLPFLAS